METGWRVKKRSDGDMGVISTDYEILLGSGSPRRKELLSEMDIPFRLIAIKDIDERYPRDMASEEVPVFLSRLKSEAYRSELSERQILITADTVVIHSGDILGKPVDGADAIKMLESLSGDIHSVVTGVTIASVKKSVSFSERTIVSFKKLSEQEISYYVEHYNPLDKAGAYGIQEWIGLVAVKCIEGCYYNVMGLPTQALYRNLCGFIAEAEIGEVSNLNWK